jgi:hypothetical protein
VQTSGNANREFVRAILVSELAQRRSSNWAPPTFGMDLGLPTLPRKHDSHKDGADELAKRFADRAALWVFVLDSFQL